MNDNKKQAVYYNPKTNEIFISSGIMTLCLDAAGYIFLGTL